MQVIDLTGLRFNKLQVLKRDLTKTGGAAYWICQCDCGNIKSIRGSDLRKGKIDCGCGLKERLSHSIDTTSQIGKKYGRLTVIERDMSKPIGHGCGSYWICQCDCGNKTSVNLSQLTSGKTKSCGCLRSELRIEKNTKDLTNQRFGMVVAKENTQQLSNHSSYIWRCECDCGNLSYYVPAEVLLSGKIHSCGCNTRSYGEQKINNILLDNNITFVQQYRFINSPIPLLRYDFAILNDDNQVIRLIEFDGEQHFRPKDIFGGEEGFRIQQQHDLLKNEYAKQCSIPLIRIPYYELNNLSLKLIMGDKYLI